MILNEQIKFVADMCGHSWHIKIHNILILEILCVKITKKNKKMRKNNTKVFLFIIYMVELYIRRGVYI